MTKYYSENPTSKKLEADDGINVIEIDEVIKDTTKEINNNTTEETMEYIKYFMLLKGLIELDILMI